MNLDLLAHQEKVSFDFENSNNKVISESTGAKSSMTPSPRPSPTAEGVQQQQPADGEDTEMVQESVGTKQDEAQAEEAMES